MGQKKKWRGGRNPRTKWKKISECPFFSGERNFSHAFIILFVLHYKVWQISYFFAPSLITRRLCFFAFFWSSFARLWANSRILAGNFNRFTRHEYEQRRAKSKSISHIYFHAKIWIEFHNWLKKNSVNLRFSKERNSKGAITRQGPLNRGFNVFKFSYKCKVLLSIFFPWKASVVLKFLWK